MDLQSKGGAWKRQILSEVQDMISRALSGLTASVAVLKDGTNQSDGHRVLNFQGPGVSVTDNPLNRRTDILIAGGFAAGSAINVVSSMATKVLDLWNGSSNNAAPANWQTVGFSDGAWATAVANSPQSGAISGATSIWPATSPASKTARALFRQAFTLPAGTISSASLTFAVDDTSQGVWVNGNLVSGTVIPDISHQSVGGYTLVSATVPVAYLTAGASNLIAADGNNAALVSDPIGNASVAYKLTISMVGGNQVAPPPVASWTWVNQGGASASENAGGGVFLLGTTGAGNNVRTLVKARPSAPPWTVTAMLIPRLSIGDSQTLGLLFRESSSGKLAVCGVILSGNQLQLYSAKYTSPTALSANYTTVTIGWGGWASGGPLYLRMQDDNTNRICSWSTDGVNYVAFHTVGRTDFLTADQVGVYVDPFGATPPLAPAVTLMSWKEA